MNWAMVTSVGGEEASSREGAREENVLSEFRDIVKEKNKFFFSQNEGYSLCLVIIGRNGVRNNRSNWG